MEKLGNKYADRGVAKPIALRLPPEVREQAVKIASKQKQTLNRHATEAYLIGVEVIESRSANKSSASNNKPMSNNPSIAVA